MSAIRRKLRTDEPAHTRNTAFFALAAAPVVVFLALASVFFYRMVNHRHTDLFALLPFMVICVLLFANTLRTSHS